MGGGKMVKRKIIVKELKDILPDIDGLKEMIKERQDPCIYIARIENRIKNIISQIEKEIKER